MSYSACSNSAVFKPDGYPIGAIGSLNEPVINGTPVASTTLLQPIAALTLPEGRWLITGTLFVVSTVGGETITGNTGIAKNSSVFWRSQNPTAAAGLSISLSAIVESNGTDVITIPMTYTTSAAATYALATNSSLSKVQFIRIA